MESTRKNEQRYYVLFPDTQIVRGKYTFLNSSGGIDFTTNFNQVDTLTEQEIRAFDKRYMFFAKEVETVLEERERGPKVHELKILPVYFEAVVTRKKRFEIRKNDRDFRVGDILRLREYQNGQYTGELYVTTITYLTDYAQQANYVVMGIE
ncbi:TPA: DUF3850 domain-containing protein [Enterococcus faecalis]